MNRVVSKQAPEARLEQKEEYHDQEIFGCLELAGCKRHFNEFLSQRYTSRLSVPNSEIMNAEDEQSQNDQEAKNACQRRSSP